MSFKRDEKDLSRGRATAGRYARQEWISGSRLRNGRVKKTARWKLREEIEGQGCGEAVISQFAIRTSRLSLAAREIFRNAINTAVSIAHHQFDNLSNRCVSRLKKMKNVEKKDTKNGNLREIISQICNAFSTRKNYIYIEYISTLDHCAWRRILDMITA